MIVFEELETIEALRFEEGFVDGESVSTANVIIFPPKDDGMEMVLNVFRTIFAESSFLQLLDWIWREQ